MHRFFHPTISVKDVLNQITLEGEEAHHAIRVLRLRKGDKLILLNGKGAQFLCDCINIEKNKLILNIVEKKVFPPPGATLTLIQAIPKGRLIDEIIEKSIELGVNRIIPLITRRVVPSWESSEKLKRIERWRQIAISAMKQCGQTYLPLIEEPINLEVFLEKKEKFEINLVCALSDETKHPRIIFENFRNQYQRNPFSICVWIGPEGDFTPEELHLIKENGALPISLGNLVLRVETAAIYALTILNYELNWLKANPLTAK